MRNALLASCVALLPLGFVVSSAWAVTCPPGPGEVLAVGQVGGGPGLDKLVERQEDEKGNKVELWCIDDTWFGKRYVPNIGIPVWVGKCWFKGGMNWQDKCGPDITGTRGKTDEWEKLSWTNVQPPPSGTFNWEYTYWATGPDEGKLKVDKTLGSWSDPYHAPDCSWWRQYTITSRQEYSFGDAPTEFSDIPGYDPGPDSIIPYGIAGGWMDITALHTGPLWEYGIRLPAVGGTGSESDPYCGLTVDVLPGDTWTLAAVGVSNPYVTGLAATMGWSVGEWGSDFVSYVYEGGPTVLEPGYMIDGFGFQSYCPAGQQTWTCYGEGLNYAGSTVGPVPEPITLLGVFMGVSGIGAYLRKRVKAA